MQSEKTLTDKPGILTLEQFKEVKKVQQENEANIFDSVCETFRSILASVKSCSENWSARRSYRTIGGAEPLGLVGRHRIATLKTRANGFVDHKSRGIYVI